MVAAEKSVTRPSQCLSRALYSGHDLKNKKGSSAEGDTPEANAQIPFLGVVSYVWSQSFRFVKAK
jgi:hypothetical protein